MISVASAPTRPTRFKILPRLSPASTLPSVTLLGVAGVAALPALSVPLPAALPLAPSTRGAAPVIDACLAWAWISGTEVPLRHRKT
jgi:hypothetical protein